MRALGVLLLCALSACDRSGPDLDQDDDGYEFDVDCADKNPAVHPGADEVCNGFDDNCDRVVDDDALDRTTWYFDLDGDGHAGDSMTLLTCAAPEGGFVDTTDCDDLDPKVSPDGLDVCNGVDDDCSGTADDGEDALTFFVDADGDGFGSQTTVEACAPSAGQVDNAEDCADDDATRHPGADEVCNALDDDCDDRVDDEDGDLEPGSATRWWVDLDDDGHGGQLFSVLLCEAPDRFVATNDDCDDDDATLSPSQPEACNSLDDNCDGLVDDDDPLRVGETGTKWFADGDGDGWGSGEDFAWACLPPEGYGTDQSDCADDDIAIHPQADEVCNDLDDDCDQLVDDADEDLTAETASFWRDVDGDGWGTAALWACEDFGFGWAEQLGDCNDGNTAVNPGAVEVCDHVDNDCADGADSPDAADAKTWLADGDHDGWGDADVTVTACWQAWGWVPTSQPGDCDDDHGQVHPQAPEICDLQDNDCDGTVDLDTPGIPQWCEDADGDGHGVAGTGVSSCGAVTGRTTACDDCNDGWVEGGVAPGDISPSAVEVDDDGVDNDCNGVVDVATPLPGGIVTEDTTWTSAGGPWLVDTNILVQSGATLTIEPCTTIQVAPEMVLQIEGTLIARGDPDCPIVLTSALHPAAPGDWIGLFFTSSSVGATYDASWGYVSGSILEHVVVKYGGGSTAAIQVAGPGVPYLNEVEVAFSGTSGFSSMGDPNVIDASWFHDNVGAAVFTRRARTRLTDSVFAYNGNGASLQDGNGAGSLIHGSTFTDHSGRGLALNSGNGWTVTDNLFARNGSFGLHSFAAPGTYARNLFLDNGIGLHVGYRGDHHIDDNILAGNGVALRTEFGGNFLPSGNTFYGNEAVHRRVGSSGWNPTYTFSYNLFQRHDADPVLSFPPETSQSPATIDHNNFVEVQGDQILLDASYAAGSAVLNAESNWWGGESASVRVLDFLDEATLAVVDHDPVLASPDLAAPISVPVGLVAAWNGDAIEVSWQENPETDLAGYRVWYGTEDGWFLEGTGADEGASGFSAAATTATITGLDPTSPWRVSVTALDADADGTGDLFQGHESWFAEPVHP